MGLVHSADVASAAWVVSSPTPPDQLIRFGPVGYEAYARLRYIPDPTQPGQLETDARVPADHPLWASQARRALDTLEDFTGTPHECFFCVWEGTAGDVLSPIERQGPLVVVPHRRYVLFTGPLRSYIEARDRRFDDSGPVPALVWPADRRWFLASDVDTHWAGIGATSEAIDRLLNTSGLDVVPATPNEPQPGYG